MRRTIDPSVYYSSNAKPKTATRFRTQVCLTQNKNTSYSEVFKKRMSIMNRNNTAALNRSVERVRNGRDQEQQYTSVKNKTLQVDSNVLNISIHSNDDRREEEQYSQEEYPDEDFIKVEDFIKIQDLIGVSTQSNTREELNLEFDRMISQITRIQQDCQYQQAKIKTVQQNLRGKKKVLAGEKRPVDVGSNLHALQYEIGRQIEKHSSQIRKAQKSLNQSNTKRERELQSLKERYQNLKDKHQYLVEVRKEEEQKQAELQDERPSIEKQKKQEVGVLQGLHNAKQANLKLKHKLDSLSNMQLPTLETHKTYISQLQRAFVEREIQKISSHLSYRQEQADAKKRSQKLKQELSATTSQLQSVKKKWEQKKKKYDKSDKEMKDKSALYMNLMQQEQELDLSRK